LWGSSTQLLWGVGKEERTKGAFCLRREGGKKRIRVTPNQDGWGRGKGTQWSLLGLAISRGLNRKGRPQFYTLNRGEEKETRTTAWREESGGRLPGAEVEIASQGNPFLRREKTIGKPFVEGGKGEKLKSPIKSRRERSPRPNSVKKARRAILKGEGGIHVVHR